MTFEGSYTLHISVTVMTNEWPVRFLLILALYIHHGRDISPPPPPFCRIISTKYSNNMLKLPHTLGVFTLLTSRFLKSQHFDPTIYTCAKKSQSFSFTKLRDFLVGSAHTCAITGYSACIHACSACSMHEGRGYTDGSTQGHVMKNRDISRLAFTLANFAWNFATFQKNRTPACDFSGDVSRVFMRCC